MHVSWGLRALRRLSASVMNRRGARWLTSGAIALAAVGLTAAPAGATLLLIDGNPQGASNLNVQYSWGYGTFTITNPLSNGSGENITEIRGFMSPWGLDDFHETGPSVNHDGSSTNNFAHGFCSVGDNSFEGEPVGQPQRWYSFACNFAEPTASTDVGALLPGQSQTFHYNFGNGPTSKSPAGLDQLWVSFDFSNQPPFCRPSITNSMRTAPLAFVADDCTTPARTSITEDKINQRKHTAFFRFKADHAKKFQCELLRNGKVKYKASCNSPKPYSNRLESGHYVFIVAGVNKVGKDPNPAMRSFVLR
jgi:hypothetical protein